MVGRQVLISICWLASIRPTAVNAFGGSLFSQADPDSHRTTHHHVDAQQDSLGAVASESSICSKIGIDILRLGGNAADSMVATTFCVGVIGMHHSGIHGGGFMLVRSGNGSYEFIDFRETAPAAAFEDMYKNNTSGSIYTGLASAVPGEVRGLAYLHENYGRLPWRDVVMPAVHVARSGFPVTIDLVRYMSFAISSGNDFLTSDPAWALDFAPNGTLLKLNDTITRKRYANTLETIAEEGADAFYTGAIAQTMIETTQEHGGIMTMEDLKNYKVITRKPWQIDYRGFRVFGGGAPSSGAVALSTLKIIEGFSDIGASDMLNLSTHRFDEALRFAYGQRSELGDPAFAKHMNEYEADMLNTKTAASIRAKINDKHTLNVSAYDPSGFEILQTAGTSGLVTSDRDGLAISLTTTINLLFGSQIIVPETGIILNNEMNDFSIPGKDNAFGYIPSPINYIRPGKRPLSSIVPTIVEFANGTLFYVVGAAGGSRIITSTIQTLWHVMDHNMTAPEAIAAPRLHDQLMPNQVTFEYSYDNSTVAFMEKRGHNITWVPPFYSAVQALRRLPNGTFEVASESRQKNSGGYAL